MLYNFQVLRRIIKGKTISELEALLFSHLFDVFSFYTKCKVCEPNKVCLKFSKSLIGNNGI